MQNYANDFGCMHTGTTSAHLSYVFIFLAQIRSCSAYSRYTRNTLHTVKTAALVSSSSLRWYQRKHIVKCSAFYTEWRAARTHTFDCPQWGIIISSTLFDALPYIASFGRELASSRCLLSSRHLGRPQHRQQLCKLYTSLCCHLVAR